MKNFFPEQNDFVKILLKNNLKIEGNVLLWDENNNKIVLSMNVEGSYFIIYNTEEIIGCQVVKNKKVEIKENTATATGNNYQDLIKKQKEIQNYIEQVKNDEFQYSIEMKPKILLDLQNKLQELDKEIIKYKITNISNNKDIKNNYEFPRFKMQGSE